MKDKSGNAIPFPGELGMAPTWEHGACTKDCQEQISACVLAHVNTAGVHIPLWMDGDSPALGWGQSPSYPYQEGSFFGNIFTSPPTMYYCDGKDFAVGVVQGRIGANGTTGPYKNPFAKGFCNTSCTPQDMPNQNDGFKACMGYNHVVTVWRNVDSSSNVAGSTAAFDPTIDYKVCNRVGGGCLDLKNGATAYWTRIVLNPYSTSSTTIRWNIIQNSSGQYKFVNKRTGMLLDVSGGGTANGTELLIYPETGGLNQIWTFSRTGDGFYKFSPASNAGSGLDNHTTGGNVVEWSYTGASSQEWSVTPAN
jgi:hypothetical protein